MSVKKYSWRMLWLCLVYFFINVLCEVQQVIVTATFYLSKCQRTHFFTLTWVKKSFVKSLFKHECLYFNFNEEYVFFCHLFYSISLAGVEQYEVCSESSLHPRALCCFRLAPMWLYSLWADTSKLIWDVLEAAHHSISCRQTEGLNSSVNARLQRLDTPKSYSESLICWVWNTFLKTSTFLKHFHMPCPGL